jgi:hypothetical protein
VVKNLGLVFFMVAMAILGVICFWIPEKIQVLALKWVALGSTAKWRTLRHFVGSKQYLYNLRAVGVLALLSAAFLLWMLMKS